MSGLLILTILLPAAGALVLLGAGRNLGVHTARLGALGIALVTFFLAAALVNGFPREGTPEAMQDYAASDYAWIDVPLGGEGKLEVRFSFALDGLALWLFALTTLLMITCVLVSWEAVRDRAHLFYAMLLLLESGCLGVFTSRDLLLFYVFFEFTLIPLFFLIGIWGSEDRQHAAHKFFLYTLAGSLLTFLGLLALVLWVYAHPAPGAEPLLTFSIPALTEALGPGGHAPMPHAMQLWVFLALFAGFAIKVPLFPLHTWLPLAHVQAPAAGSVVLAGILLKIGTYGFLRFNIAMLPEATHTLMPYLLWLSVAGILYGALVALAQRDMKRLIAYSSVSHLGFCMLGLFALNELGVSGATLQMVNHGISTGGLFALIGMLYERYHTREIAALGGLSRRLPWLAFFMIVFTMSSIGLPGLNGFAGEFLLLTGMFQRAWFTPTEPFGAQMLVIAVLAVAGVVLGAWYMLYLVQRVFFGPLREPHDESPHDESPHGGQASVAAGHVETTPDLSLREILALAPLAVAAVWIGLWPAYFLDPMQPTLTRLTAAARATVDTPQDTPAAAAVPPRAAISSSR